MWFAFGSLAFFILFALLGHEFLFGFRIFVHNRFEGKVGSGYGTYVVIPLLGVFLLEVLSFFCYFLFCCFFCPAIVIMR